MTAKSQRHRPIGDGRREFREWSRQLFSRIAVGEQHACAAFHQPARDTQSAAKLPEPHDGDAAAVE